MEEHLFAKALRPRDWPVLLQGPKKVYAHSCACQLWGYCLNEVFSFCHVGVTKKAHTKRSLILPLWTLLCPFFRQTNAIGKNSRLREGKEFTESLPRIFRKENS